ncbi:recombinase family protein [Dehalococcoidia bacterium]|nr:recombinase family protein [Dehalococcoidia bacterium]
MLTIAEIIEIEKVKVTRRQPSNEELRRLPLDRPARVFGRLSDPKQIQESLQSMAELADLVRLARQDGFHTELSQEEIERRLRALQRADPEALRYWADGQLIVDLRDLGISGRLGPDKRPALAELMADLSRGESPDVTGSIYLSSEGLSRLSRDQDRVVGYQLLKLMKEANCRVRTPYGILNARIDADWKELA